MLAVHDSSTEEEARTRGTLRYRHGSNLPCVPADPLKPAVCNESIIQFEENSHVEVLCLVNYIV